MLKANEASESKRGQPRLPDSRPVLMRQAITPKIKQMNTPNFTGQAETLNRAANVLNRLQMAVNKLQTHRDVLATFKERPSYYGRYLGQDINHHKERMNTARRRGVLLAYGYSLLISELG